MAFKDACVIRLYFLYDSAIEFLGIDCQLAGSSETIKNDIAYLADIFTLMNEVNKKLQG